MLTLVIGDKNLSSWSLRPWLALKHLGLPFQEIKLKLDTPAFKQTVSRYSPTARVPVLIDGDVHVWDSLAILEYVNEKAGGRGWPSDAAQRAHARSISAEMHSGFAALRQNWPMQAAAKNVHAPLPVEGGNDVARIDQLWQDCRARHGANGPWLFGNFSIADAMYAPVVLRFNTYQPRLSSLSDAYVEHVLADPPMREWLREAHDEIAA